jgi:Zn-dependent protease with chaperone function
VANEDKATRYHRLQRRASILATVLSATILALLLVTGASEAMRDLVAGWFSSSFILTVVGYVIVLGLLLEVAGLPLAFYRGVTLERRYGLSTQTTARWWLDHIKAGGISLVFAIVGALIVLSLMRWDAERWWVYAAAIFTVILVLLAQLAPVVLLPLFYEITPLSRDHLRDRLVALAGKAGTRIAGVFEWRLSDRTKKANAALAGIGRTRRILLSDTLLAEHSDDEIEVILAHELAHHVYRDIWSALLIETVLIALGCFAADRVLDASAASAGLNGKGDVAGLPLLVLTLGSVSLALMPIVNAFSRAHERRADRFALTMTKNAPAFITAMKRLAAQNLAEEEPSRLVQILFHTHPTINARVRAAQQYQTASTRPRKERSA